MSNEQQEAPPFPSRSLPVVIDAMIEAIPTTEAELIKELRGLQIAAAAAPPEFLPQCWVATAKCMKYFFPNPQILSSWHKKVLTEWQCRNRPGVTRPRDAFMFFEQNLELMDKEDPEYGVANDAWAEVMNYIGQMESRCAQLEEFEWLWKNEKRIIT